MLTVTAGGRRSGRDRKVLTGPCPFGAAVARVRASGSQPRVPARAIQAVPAVSAPRNLRRVIAALRLLLPACSPKFDLSSLASVAPPNRAKPPSPRAEATKATRRTLYPVVVAARALHECAHSLRGSSRRRRSSMKRPGFARSDTDGVMLNCVEHADQPVSLTGGQTR